MKTVFSTSRSPSASLVGSPRSACGGEVSFDNVSSAEFPSDLLPAWLTEVLADALRGQQGAVEEIRLRAGRQASVTVGGRNVMCGVALSGADLSALLTSMCGGSLYAYSQTIHQGYVSLPNGIRVGVVGRAVCEEGRVIGVCEISGLCIRLPHRHGSVGREICRLFRCLNSERTAPRGILIYAPPGEGKTTLLRGIIAGLAGKDGGIPLRTVVVDTRGELGFETDGEGLCLDILRGYPRGRGVEIATRTLSAQVIVCDEIGDTEEALTLISSHHGGVPLIASAHGGSPEELLRRTGIRLLHEAYLFGAYVGIRRNGRGDFEYRITPRDDADRMALQADNGLSLLSGGVSCS